MKEIIIVDSCLRDGNHTIGNKYNLIDISRVVEALDEAKLDYIEVGYGYGLASLEDDSKPSDLAIINQARKELKNSKLAILVFPNYANLEDLEEILRQGPIGLIRIAVQALDTRPAEEYIKLCKDYGINVGGFMMMSHRADVEKLLEEAKMLESYGVNSITIVDSAGYMETNEVREKVSTVRENVSSDISIGFHCHDNLGLAVGNSIAAIESGADLIDSALGGIGAGAGNTPTESLVAVLDKADYKTRSDLFKLFDGAKVLKDVVAQYGVELANREDIIMIGYSGIYSTFMKVAKEVSQNYNVDYKKLVIQAGQEGLLPGEEKQLIEIAKQTT